MENDIVCRYYYRKGAIAHQLRDDKTLAEALRLLSHPEEYRHILTPNK